MDELACRVLRAELDTKIRGDWKLLLFAAKTRFLNRQSVSKAFEVGQRHYDLGNDLYRAMLDKRLNYTCGYWKHAQSLAEAQVWSERPDACFALTQCTAVA